VDTGGVAIGGVLLIPLIVGLVQFFKRLVTKSMGNFWLFLSFLLGVIGECVVWLIATGTTFASWSIEQWATMIVMGLAFGLAASKAYDLADASDSAIGKATRSIAGENYR